MTSWTQKQIQKQRNKDNYYIDKVAKELQEYTPKQQKKIEKITNEKTQT